MSKSSNLLYPETPNTPVRTPVKSSSIRSTGGFYLEGITPYDAEHESANEDYAILLLTLCHDVISIESQPSRKSYIDSLGEARAHIPDLLVTTNRGKFLIEVKSIHDLVSPKNLDKYIAIAKSYKQNRESFKFLVDAQLFESPRIDSALLLTRYITSLPNDYIFKEAAEVLENGPMRISDLILATSLDLVDVYVLIARRHLCFDWQEPLSAESFTSLPLQPYKGLSLEDLLLSTQFGSFLEKLAMGHRPENKRILAAAQTWRQRRKPSASWCIAGEFKVGTPLRNLGTEERIPRNPRLRRGFTLDTDFFKNNTEGA